MIYSILTEGFIYAIMVLGVFMSYRVLNFCDMTVDGAFPMGGCILAVSLSMGIPPVIALTFAFLGGVFTSLIYTKLRIPDLLAGILTMTMLYSVNLRIMGNRANLSFLKIKTPFTQITEFFEEKSFLPPELGILLFVLIFTQGTTKV